MTNSLSRRRAAKALPDKTPPRSRAAAAKSAKPGAGDSPYHHGALDTALLAAAETVLERDGLQGLTLRAVAR